MKVCVLGMGYMGLPTSCLISNSGHRVIGIDIDKNRVELLNRGVLPFEENGLPEIFENARKNSFIAKSEVEDSDVFIIEVPTPVNLKEKKAELKYVKSAAEMIVPYLKKGNLVILESTVPPLTCRNFLIPILERSHLSAGADFSVAHCPERAFPGQTLYELVNNDRVIGGIDEKSCALAKELYSSFVKAKISTTDTTTAEFVKLSENTFRDINIALANEFALICEQIGVDSHEAIALANRHPRVKILSPGPGVGGHCIAFDPWFMTQVTDRAKIIPLARKINDRMPSHVVELSEKMLSGIENPVVSVLGVSYKADVDDTRESPAIGVIKLAKRKGWKVKVHDPIAKRFEYRMTDLESALSGSDCAIIVANHKEFLDIDFSKFGMRNKNILDTRNFLNHEKLRKEGFKVFVLGNGKSIA